MIILYHKKHAMSNIIDERTNHQADGKTYKSAGTIWSKTRGKMNAGTQKSRYGQL